MLESAHKMQKSRASLVVNFIFLYCFEKFVTLAVSNEADENILSPLADDTTNNRSRLSIDSRTKRKKEYNDSLNVVLKSNATPSPGHPVRQRATCNKPRPDLCARVIASAGSGRNEFAAAVRSFA